MYESIDTNDGKQLIEVVEGEQNKLLYSCGIGEAINFKPINFDSGSIRMHSAKTYLSSDTNKPCGEAMNASELTVSLSIKECIARGIIDVEKLKDFYIETVLQKQSPSPVVGGVVGSVES